jgi:hypothetical protein
MNETFRDMINDFSQKEFDVYIKDLQKRNPDAAIIELLNRKNLNQERNEDAAEKMMKANKNKAFILDRITAQLQKEWSEKHTVRNVGMHRDHVSVTMGEGDEEYRYVISVIEEVPGEK